MSTPMRRERGDGPARMFEEWLRSLPIRRPFGLDWPGEDLIRVDEYREGNTQVVRAELPGVDPDRDIDITVDDGMLRIRAERRLEQRTTEKGYTRQEMRYGTLTRTLPLPEGASESDIKASYKDGILEVRVPVPEPPSRPAPTKIPISRR